MQTIENPVLTSSRGLAFILPHRITTHFDAMGVMDKSVEDAVGPPVSLVDGARLLTGRSVSEDQELRSKSRITTISARQQSKGR
jgi:hypothetical protein